MSTALASTLTLLLLAAVPAEPVAAQDGQQLFQAQCARCHGESGDGHGTDLLDRPARSFAEGGFSFGDTELAIYRTITHGIPGSPMPAFGDGLSEDQRRSLAAYVRALCPPREDVAEEDTELLVVDHPLAAKGLLPPVVAGARSWPRGLLLATTDGLTFEYRGDDLRLLAVRQGPFARRSDWTGRGGTPLQPLGTVFWLNEAGDPPAMFFIGATLRGDHGDPGDTPQGGHAVTLQALEIVPVSVATPEQGPTITSQLINRDGQILGRLISEPSRLSTRVGSGFTRRLTVKLNVDAGPLVVKLPWSHRTKSIGGPLGVELTEADPRAEVVGFEGLWSSSGGGELRVISWTSGVSSREGFGQLLFSPTPEQRSFTLEIDVLLLQRMPADKVALARELLR